MTAENFSRFMARRLKTDPPWRWSSDGVRMRFAAAAWNYGLSIPLDKAALEQLALADRKAVVSMSLRCISGHLEAALVGPDFNHILDVAAIEPSEKADEIILLAYRLKDVGGIILRTLGPAASLCDVLVQESRFRCLMHPQVLAFSNRWICDCYLDGPTIMENARTLLLKNSVRWRTKPSAPP